jgi:hypothetical protein
MTIKIWTVEESLSDSSCVYRIVISDDETPSGEVVSFDVVSELDAIKLADGFANLIRRHTNYDVVQE